MEDRKTERQKDRQTERQKDRQTERQKDRKTDRQTDLLTNRDDRETESHTDRKTDRQNTKLEILRIVADHYSMSKQCTLEKISGYYSNEVLIAPFLLVKEPAWPKLRITLCKLSDLFDISNTCIQSVNSIM